MRIEQPDSFAEFMPDDPQRLGQVGVVGHNDECVRIVAEGVNQEIGGEVHVRALLLHLDYVDETWPASYRLSQGKPGNRGEELTLMDRELGKCAQCPDVGVLPDVHVGVSRPAAYPSSEVP